MGTQYLKKKLKRFLILIISDEFQWITPLQVLYKRHRSI